jgi:Cof subfamily protein (haloacid dehalogenase superfamily)
MRTDSALRTDFKGILLITDLDDTAFDASHRVSEKNLAAVLEFIEMGGAFSVATGRGVKSVARYGLPINAPSIVSNGTAVYDFKSGEFLWRLPLSGDYKELMRDLIERFPGLGSEWVTLYDHIVLTDSAEVANHLNEVESIPFLNSDVSQLDNLEPPMKFMFAWDVENLTKVLEYINFRIKTENLPFKCNFSYPALMELTDVNAGKGPALKRLSETTGIPRRKIIAMGDAFSDFEMIKSAGVGLAVGNSPKEVRDGADAVVRDRDSNALEGAVALLKNFRALFREE